MRRREEKRGIDWKNLTSIVGFIGALAGGYYKLQTDNEQMVQEQIVIQKAERARWQLDSLRIDRKFKELRWEMQDSMRMKLAKLKDELK